MKDLTTKGTGNSRFLKSVSNFRTLYPTYNDFAAALVAGTLPIDFNGINPAGCLQVGTPLNKATLLEDSVANKFRVADAVPNTIFSILGQYNEYWWKRRVTSDGYYEVRTPSTDGEVKFTDYTTWYLISDENDHHLGQTVQYSDSITINQSTGVVSLSSPQTVQLYHPYEDVTTAQVLKGKYFKGGYGSGSTQIHYMSENATIRTGSYTQDGEDHSCIFVVTTRNHYYESTEEMYNVSSQYVRVDGQWMTVHSTDRNAYPDGGISGGYEYQYIGVPFENLPLAPKIEIGTYVGTGTYGASNPTSLTFSFRPQFVLLSDVTSTVRMFGYDGGTYSSYNLYAMYINDLTETFVVNKGFTYYGSDSCSYGKRSSDGKSIYWYSPENSTRQCNSNSSIYRYIAIG